MGRRDIPIRESIEWGFRLQKYLDGYVNAVEWCAKKMTEEKEKEKWNTSLSES